jgi:hypothetical protein
MHHRNVAYRAIEDKHAFSPVLFSVRHMDRSPELETEGEIFYARCLNSSVCIL